jgi:hypothetical protein
MGRSIKIYGAAIGTGKPKTGKVVKVPHHSAGKTKQIRAGRGIAHAKAHHAAKVHVKKMKKAKAVQLTWAEAMKKAGLSL